MKPLQWLLMLIICAVAATSQAAKAPARAALTEQVAALGPDQAIQLATSGSAVFADIIFPDAALAEQWLGTNLVQKPLTFTAHDPDRYGRRLIHSDMVPDMLRAGVAVTYATAKLPAGWQAAEASARLAKRGVWGQGRLVVAPQNAAQHIHQFRVVEGTVTRVFTTKSATYVNFGDNWQSDFSVTIAGRARRGMKEVLAQLHEGTRVRVRGTLYEENGPMVKITRPEQFEIY